MLGTTKGISIDTGNLLLGAYFEAGIGFINSDTNTTIGSMNTVGNANYYGGGAIVRYAMDNGFYTEGFFRLGAMDNDMQSINESQNFEHASTSMYFGAGVNLGYELDLFKARDMFDIYNRYTWGHLNGTEQNIDNQSYKFDAINSYQLSVGVRYNFIQQSMFSPYIGVAAEYEFDAEANVTIRENIKTVSPNLTGVTGLAELGLRITPSKNLPLTMAINFGGHIGKRNGLETSFDIEWRFGSRKKELQEIQRIIDNENIRKAKALEEKIENDKIEKAKELQRIIDNKNIKVESVEEGIVVKVGELLFKIESYELTAEGEAGLQIIIDEIKRTYPDKKIIVSGHTDNTGTLEYNQYLSEQRAKTIADIMKNSIEKDKLLHEGKAHTEPIDTNDTKEGRAKNRRVEIIITM